MADRKVRLEVEAVVDGENPALCGLKCHGVNQYRNTKRGWLCRIFDEPIEFVDQVDDTNEQTKRCDACKTSELPALEGDSRRPDTKTAYLVVHLDTTHTPPVFLGVGIYSEPARSLTGAIGPGRFALDVHEARGPDFETARRRILEMPEPYRSVFKWALDVVPESGR